MVDVIGASEFVFDEMRELARLRHHGRDAGRDSVANVASDILQALAHVSQHLARLSVVFLLLRLHLLLRLQILIPLVVRLELLLQLRDVVRALLVLLLEDGLDSLELSLVGAGCQLQVLIDVV